ncbi:hypothetical protein SAMN05444008_11295 [Cnuella takakiae]|uniref:Uncharacterized protein n=1 Tax=Cnuella takakiae TaxID=1302690 RepID=A0A1M5EM37_9BACT|nr:hypothetical protein BUE76_04375 [Cnuella takakiae]SHF80092.1 hypothetical protein SAMN05444008_11295 [Cnuella takakiae]
MFRRFDKVYCWCLAEKLTSSKWAKMTRCSQDIATRDIQDLINKEILEKKQAGGRSTSCQTSEFEA